MKKLLSGLLSLAVISTMVFYFSTATFAAGTLTEYEKINTTDIYNNDSYTGAQLVFASSLLDKTYSYVQGSFYGMGDRYDCYSFGLGKSDGSNGRIAIKLEGIPAGHNYDLQLLDQNGTPITSSKRAGNNNEIVRTPVISAYTQYYVCVIPVSVPSYEASSYQIIFDTNIVSYTKASTLYPFTLNSTSNVWSADAYVNNSSLPADAVITSAKVQAQKSSVKNTYNNQLRVKVGSGSYQMVVWEYGDIDVPGLIGQNAQGYWYVGFSAAELPVLIGGKLTYLGIVSMKMFKITIQYEYDRYPNY